MLPPPLVADRGIGNHVVRPHEVEVESSRVAPAAVEQLLLNGFGLGEQALQLLAAVEGIVGEEKGDESIP